MKRWISMFVSLEPNWSHLCRIRRERSLLTSRFPSVPVIEAPGVRGPLGILSEEETLADYSSGGFCLFFCRKHFGRIMNKFKAFELLVVVRRLNCPRIGVYLKCPAEWHLNPQVPRHLMPSNSYGNVSTNILLCSIFV